MLLLFSTGACGGVNAWGTNGNAVGEDGMQITMNLQYAAGHTGSFEMAYSCGGTTEDDLKAVRCSRLATLLPRASARPVLLSTRRVGGVRVVWLS